MNNHLFIYCTVACRTGRIVLLCGFVVDPRGCLAVGFGSQERILEYSIQFNSIDVKIENPTMTSPLGSVNY